jgi:hypothetical protein
MKKIIIDTLKKTLESYQDTEELTFLIEQTDYEGKNCFWYISNFELYFVLDCRMVDKVIQKKWKGKYELNSSIFDYSTSYCLLTDDLKIFETDNIFLELYYKIFTFDCSQKTH